MTGGNIMIPCLNKCVLIYLKQFLHLENNTRKKCVMNNYIALLIQPWWLGGRALASYTGVDAVHESCPQKVTEGLYHEEL